MAEISLNISDDLWKKAERLAEHQGVSLDRFVTATLAASIAQEEALEFAEQRIRNENLDELEARVLRFMTCIKPGSGPSADDVQRAIDSA